MDTHILAQGVLDGGGTTGFVTRLDENAEPVWLTTLGSEDEVQTAGLAFDGKGGVVVGNGGDLVKLDGATGEPVWEVDPGDTVLEVLEVHSFADGDSVALATADDSSGCGRAVVFAVSTDGQQLWSRELPANHLFLRLAGHERGVVIARLEQPPDAHCDDLHGEGVVIAVDSISDTGAVEWTVQLEPRDGYSWYPWYGDVALGGGGEVLLSLGEINDNGFPGLEHSMFEVDKTGVIAQTKIGEGRQLEAAPDHGVYFLTQTGRTVGRWCPQ
ncbi:MAG: PQQ-binding-like beta-propeller repeat protein [Myxococcota bacterium]